jgi:hypothetical protein
MRRVKRERQNEEKCQLFYSLLISREERDTERQWLGEGRGSQKCQFEKKKQQVDYLPN